MMSDLHFLRPIWLIGLPLGIGFIYFILRQHHTREREKTSVIPQAFQPYLMIGAPSMKRQRWPLALIPYFAWFCMIVALSGPCWQKLPQPVKNKRDGLVIVMDLSYSMLSADIKPNRFTRARYKLEDLLASRKEGLTGLIAFAGSAHTVTPLTDDARTISGLIEALSPEIAPIPGSEVQAGIKQAVELLENSSLTHGHILLITDGIEENQITPITEAMKSTGYNLSILGVGTPEGAPLKKPNGEFLRKPDGNLIFTQLPEARLQALAQHLDGRYTRITLNDQDLKTLQPTFIGEDTVAFDSPSLETQHQRQFDQWQDEGHWFVLLLLPLVFTLFRRGVVFQWMGIILLLTVGSHANPLSANETLDEPVAIPKKPFWLTQDQAGQRAFDQGHYGEAAQLYDDLTHQAAAYYKHQAYDEALSSYQDALLSAKHPEEQESLYYNIGNTQAQRQAFEEALEAYDKTLDLNPQHEDARHNRRIVEALLQQQQTEDQQQSQQEQSSDSQSSQGSNDQQSSSSQSQNQNNPANQQPQSQQDEAQAQKPSDQESNKDQQHQTSSADHSLSDDAKQEEGNTPQFKQAPRNPDDEYIERWLKQIPDTPGNLLKNKFYLQSIEEQRARQKGRTTNRERQRNPDIYW